MDYLVEKHDEANLALETLLFNGINAEAFKAKKLSPIKPFGFSVKDIKGTLCGGITGVTYYGCLYTDMLWVEESHRKEGLGTKLMLQVEQLGKERGCTFATVNTMDWEALLFYQKLGYTIEFVREGFKQFSKLFLLRKSLKVN